MEKYLKFEIDLCLCDADVNTKTQVSRIAPIFL